MKGRDTSMKKSSFVALLLGTVAGMFFSLGMCMALLPEWNAFTEGIVFGAVGIVLGIVTVFVWRRMEHKAPIHLGGRGVMTVAVTLIGVLALGIGMSLCLVWNNMIAGILLGIAGIAVLLCLIPMVKGLK